MEKDEVKKNYSDMNFVSFGFQKIANIANSCFTYKIVFQYGVIGSYNYK